MNDSINRFLAVLAYPMASLDFLRWDYLEEYFAKENPRAEDKKELRARVVCYVKQNYTVYSYDEINLFLEKWYLYPQYDQNGRRRRCPESFTLIFKQLMDLSSSLISHRDGQIVYKYWENEVDRQLLGGFSGTNKINLFHAINRLFPLDILVILYMIKNGKDVDDLDGFYGNIKVSDALLDQVLQRGIAENHLHSGVSGAFLTIWDSFMKPLTPKRVLALKKFNPYHTFDMDAQEVRCCLWLAGAMRATVYLAVKEHKGGAVSRETKKRISLLLKLCEKKDKWKFCSEFEDGSSWEPSSYFIDFWNALPCSVEQERIQNQGYIAAMEDKENIHTSEEELFLFVVLGPLLKGAEQADKPLKQVRKLFLNYLRIKNFFYGMIVQQKTIHGLDFFSLQYYHNNSNANKTAGSMDEIGKWERAIREQLQNRDLKKLELRASIENNEKGFRNTVTSFLKAYRNILRDSYCIKAVEKNEETFFPVRPFPRVGLVLHLLKSEQDHLPEKCLKSGADDSEYLQYGSLYEQYKLQVEILKQVRKEYGRDKYLVGLDVASLENAIPTWVFGPIYEAARDSSQDPIRYEGTFVQAFQSIGFTFHAGEDFRHLLSGLRRIDEVIRRLKFHAGDRIGHGIALGCSPEEWFKNNETVILPRIEALENYIWSYRMLSNNNNDMSLINLAYLEKRIYQLAKEIYGETGALSVDRLVDGYIYLFKSDPFSCGKNRPCAQCGIGVDATEDMPKLCRYYQEGRKDDIIWEKMTLSQARHCKKYIYKMNQPIHYQVSEQELIIVSEVQKMVREYVMQQGIIVEVNPSSNVTIGDIDTLSKHQVYNLNHVSYDMGNILTCINSDDPSVFNTNVYNEMGYIYFGMLEKGVGREDLLQWMDKLRQSGMDASFIRRLDTDQQILDELDQIIDEDRKA